MNKVEIIKANVTLYTYHLDNGLDIYMIPKDNVKNYYLTLNTKYGSINTNFKFNGKEYSQPKGIAHYLEHLMFYMPDGDAALYFAKLGSSANAYTTNTVTCYEVFANSKFKDNLSYLIKFVYTPYFTKELVNNERDIIHEEIKMYEDDASTEIFHGLYQNLFINDERRYLIAGNTDDIKDIKLDDIEIAYNAFYHPQNMFMVLTGNFNPEEAVAIIEDAMKSFDFPDYKEPVLIEDNEPFKINLENSEKSMFVNKTKAAVGVKIPKSNFKSLKLSNLELKIYLNLILKINFGVTSLINEEMKSNEIINDSINIRVEEINDFFVVTFVGETDYPDYFINRIKENFENIKVSDEELKRKVKCAISDLIWIYDDIEISNVEMQEDIINYGMVITDIYKIYKSLNGEVAAKIISKLNKVLFTSNIIKPNME